MARAPYLSAGVAALLGLLSSLPCAAAVTASPRWSATWPAPAHAVEALQELDDGWLLVTTDGATATGANLAVHRSRDRGTTWASMGTVRLPAGIRRPGGRYGSVAVPQRNGTLRLLLSTDAGCLWEASLRPGRERWSGVMPAPIRASAGPLALVRLASGRLALAWTAPAAVCLAVSHNDSITWTFPQPVLGLPDGAGAADGLRLRETHPGQLLLEAGSRRTEVTESFVATGGQAETRGLRRVVMMGDSITRGARPGVTFPAVYSEHLRDPLLAAGADVHNVGIGAERTDLALQRFESDVLSQGAAIVTLMYGTNDSYVDAGRSDSRLSVDEYRKNLDALVTRARAAGVTPILMTPPRWGPQAKPDGRGANPNVALATYVEACREVARRQNVPLVDHHRRWAAREAQGIDIGAWTTDQCHPNAHGHAELAAEMLPVLQGVLRPDRR